MLRQFAASSALVLLVGIPHLSQSQSPPDLWTGTRHLAISKSTFLGEAPPKERTFAVVVSADRIKSTITGTEADGSPLNFSYAARFDGKYYPVTGRAVGDSLSFHRVSARELDMSRKLGAKVVATGTFTLSSNGKVLTIALKGADGEPGGVLVFEK